MEFIQHLRTTTGENPPAVFYDHFVYDTPDGLRLSVQGNYGAYCTPRATLMPEEYTRMEVGVLLDTGDYNELVSPNVLEEYIGKEIVERLLVHFDGSVSGFVPVELIEDVYQALKPLLRTGEKEWC